MLFDARKGQCNMATGLCSYKFSFLSSLSKLAMYDGEIHIGTLCTVHAHMSNINGKCFYCLKLLHATKAPKVCCKSWTPEQTFYDHIKFDLFHSVSLFLCAVWTVLHTFYDAKTFEGVNTFMHGNSSETLMFGLIGLKSNQHTHPSM